MRCANCRSNLGVLVRPGRASSVRISSAINPARMKKKKAVQVYITPMVLWFVVVT